MKQLLVAMLRFWKLAISPWMGSNCRFYPTCSEYAVQSLERYGTIKGMWLSFKRVLRCNSLFTGGYDPVASAPMRDEARRKNQVNEGVAGERDGSPVG